MRLVRASIVLAIAYGALFGARFLAPYSPTEQHRDHAFAPPTRVHVIDAAGHTHWPFVYATEVDTTGEHYQENVSQRYPLRLFVGGRLVSVDAPAYLFLAGTDAFGRDQASRLLYGGRVSLAAGALATTLALALGVAIGGVAGYGSPGLGWMLMRAADVLLAIPWLALLLAFRAALPLRVAPATALALITIVIGCAGWPRPARLVRAVVLSARTREHALAARAAGASGGYVLLRHVLPQTVPVLVTQASMLVPQYALAEMTLSFFGLGVAEPVPSWGTLLGDIVRQGLVGAAWWTAAPVIAVVLMFVCHFLVADALQAATQPAGA